MTNHGQLFQPVMVEQIFHVTGQPRDIRRLRDAQAMATVATRIGPKI